MSAPVNCVFGYYILTKKHSMSLPFVALVMIIHHAKKEAVLHETHPFFAIYTMLDLRQSFPKMTFDYS